MSKEPITEKPARLMYGDGRIITQQGESEGIKCLMLRQTENPKPVGHVDPMDETPVPQEECDVILFFRNIEGARTLQDELNELIAIWSRESSSANAKAERPRTNDEKSTQSRA